MTRWIVTCNPNYYDVIGAFKVLDKIDWKQRINPEIGDIVYIYVGKPFMEIKFETVVTMIDLPKASDNDNQFRLDESKYDDNGRHMELQLVREFEQKVLSRSVLESLNVKSLQGPRKVITELAEAIDNITSMLTVNNKHSYFFVFQNKTFEEEYRGGYVWSPKLNVNGHKYHIMD